jgi:uncharacterized protein (DUF433 family)
MPSLLDRITVDPDQCGGRPCIRGLRVRVVDVLELLAAGETPEQILADYPYLEREDITAAIFAAARAARAVVVTKDVDLVALLERRGPAPQVVWVTTGNVTNAGLRALSRPPGRAPSSCGAPASGSWSSGTDAGAGSRCSVDRERARNCGCAAVVRQN